jgi:enoyl-CoA hydratase/carnithine racemase
MFLYGTQIDAPQAERIGLVDHVVPKGGALQAATEKARFLAAQAPLPIALTKQILAEGLDRALEDERTFQVECFLSPDHAEGKAAFLEKREPRFGPR